MLKDKLSKLGQAIKANQEVIIKKGLVVAGVILGAVVIALVNGNQEASEMMAEESVDETVQAEQPVPAEV